MGEGRGERKNDGLALELPLSIRKKTHLDSLTAISESVSEIEMRIRNTSFINREIYLLPTQYIV